MTGSQGVRRWRGLLFTASVAAAAVAVAWYVTATPKAVAIGAGLLFTLTAAGMAAYHALHGGRRHLFSPPVLVLGYMTVGIGIKGLVDLFTARTKISGVIDPSGPAFADVLTSVFVYGLLGIVAFLIGYRAGRPRSTPPPATPSPPLDEARVRLAVGAGIAITAGAVAFFVQRLGMAILTDPGYVAVEGTYGLFWLYPLMYVSLFAWTVPVVNAWCTGRRPHPMLFGGIILTSGVIYLLTSSKAALVNPIIVLLVCYHYSVRPIRWRTMVASAGAFVIVLPLFYLHRSFGLTPEMLKFINFPLMVGGAQLLLGRSYLADSFGSVLLFTPRVYPFRYGEPWLELLYFWIPRAWWPTKPVTFSIGFGETYLSSYSDGKLSFYAPTMLGDAYLNFGVLGIVVLFFAIGFGLRRWYETMIGARPKPESVLLYAASVYWIAMGSEQSLAIVVTLILSYLALPTALVVAVRGWSPLRRRRAASA